MADRVIRPFYEIDENGKLRLHFHPGQTRAWVSKSPIVVIMAGAQSGKSCLIPWWLRREILKTAKSGQQNNYLAVSASNDLFAMAFLPAMIEVFVDVLGIGHYWTARRTLEIKCLDPSDPRFGTFYQGPRGSSSGSMWARIILRSAQSEGALESVTALAAALDEAGQSAFTNQDWEAINRRTAIARSQGAGRILIATTPYSMDSFLYEQIYIPWVEHGLDSGIDVIQFPSYYNPNWSAKEFRRQEATMPDWRAAMFLHGKFKRPAGLIYRDFDEGTMLVREKDEFNIPDHWERVVGIDFGGANTATLWLAFNPNDGRWYAYHESLMGHMPTSEHASIARAEAIGINRLTAVGGAKSEGQHRDDWWQAGFYIEEPPVYDVEAGIARVISLIKGDRLRVFASLGRLRKEFRNYSRKLDQNNEPTEQIINKNKYHILDALRYGSAWIEDSPLGVESMTYSQFIKTRELAHEPA